MTAQKNSIGAYSSRFDQAEELVSYKICHLKSSSQGNKKKKEWKRVKKNLTGIMRQDEKKNISIMGILEREEKETESV